MLLPVSQDQMSYIVGPSTRMLFAQVRDAREPITMPVIDRRVVTSSARVLGRRVLMNAPVRIVEIRPPALVLDESWTAARTYSFSITGDATPFTPDAWEWDFGDGHTSTGAAPSHTFDVVGSYNISVLVYDGSVLVGCYGHVLEVVIDDPSPPPADVTLTASDMWNSGNDVVGSDDPTGVWAARNDVTVDDPYLTNIGFAGAPVGDAHLGPAITAGSVGLISDPGFQLTFYHAGVAFDTSALSGAPSAARLRLWLANSNTYGASAHGPDVFLQNIKVYVFAGISPINIVDLASLEQLWLDEVASTTPASDDVVALADLDVAGQWVEFDLNAAGLAALNLSGTTYFIARCQDDAEDSVPANFTTANLPFGDSYESRADLGGDGTPVLPQLVVTP